LLVVTLCCCALAGCKSLDRGAATEGDGGSDTAFASELRNPSPKGESSGIDPRAREIERHLGVR
jgi:hypothetical protein